MNKVIELLFREVITQAVGDMVHDQLRLRLRLFVCLIVRAFNGKQLKLSTPKLASPWYGFTLRSKGQRSRSKSQGYRVRCRRVYAGRYNCTFFPLLYRVEYNL